jgi:hypothetical protein
MKKITLLAIAGTALTAYIFLCGYKEGPALYSGWECTGAETDNTNPAGCYSGGSCHSSAATPGITLSLVLDSAGKATTQYVPGMSYKIVLTGVNTTTNSLPTHGFQIAAITGTTPVAATGFDAGTFPGPFAPNTHYAPPATYFDVGTVEHGIQLAPVSGTGGTGTVYADTVIWTAPTSGTGTISIWAALNAVNNNGVADRGDLWNTMHIVISESPSGIASITDNNTAKVYPNPFSLNTTFLLPTEVSTGMLSLYDITGREVRQVPFSGKQVTVERGNLGTGIYFYRIVNENNVTMTGKLVIE